MEVSFYFDEMLSRKVAEQLASRGTRVLLAVDVGLAGKDDLSEHLRFATEQGLILVTFDRAFAGRAMTLTDHAGVICWTGAQDDIGSIVRRLTEFAEQHATENAAGNVFWLR